VEVCSTSTELNKAKLQRFNKAGVPWIEIHAVPNINPKVTLDEEGQTKTLTLEVNPFACNFLVWGGGEVKGLYSPRFLFY